MSVNQFLNTIQEYTFNVFSYLFFMFDMEFKQEYTIVVLMAVIVVLSVFLITFTFLGLINSILYFENKKIDLMKKNMLDKEITNYNNTMNIII